MPRPLAPALALGLALLSAPAAQAAILDGAAYDVTAGSIALTPVATWTGPDAGATGDDGAAQLTVDVLDGGAAINLFLIAMQGPDPIPPMTIAISGLSLAGGAALTGISLASGGPYGALTVTGPDAFTAEFLGGTPYSNSVLALEFGPGADVPVPAAGLLLLGGLGALAAAGRRRG